MAGAGPRRSRRTLFQRLVIATNVVAVVGFLGAAVGLAYGYGKFASIPRVEIGDALSTNDDGADDRGAENFLVVGVDSAEGLDPDDPVAATRTRVGGIRSDTMMVLRVDPTSTRAALLSLPRDLYVPIGGGSRGSARLNAAVHLGGPELLIETVSDYFGIPIHHYVQVDFFGFGRLVDAIDGVPLSFPNPVRDRRSGLDVPEAGCVTLDARQALGFVRSRAYQELVDGRWRTDGSGDLGRIRRQQQFIVAAAARAFDRGVRNPVNLDELIDSAIGAITLDDTLDGDDVATLALRFRGFEPSALDLYELPVGSAIIGGADVLRLRSREAEPILDVFRDRDPGVLDESAVRVRVLNGTGEPGEAADAAAEFRAAGFAIGGTGNAPRLGVRTTEIRYPRVGAAEADLVRRWMAGRSRLVVDDDLELVTVVTGSSWSGLRSTAIPPGPTTTTTLPMRTTTSTGSTTSILGAVDGAAGSGSACG